VASFISSARWPRTLALMWIFSSSSSDPMLLDSCAGLRELHARIETFLKSTDQTLALSAATDGILRRTSGSFLVYESPRARVQLDCPVVRITGSSRWPLRPTCNTSTRRSWSSTRQSIIIGTALQSRSSSKPIVLGLPPMRANHAFESGRAVKRRMFNLCSRRRAGGRERYAAG
jgi:hypothetical protein